MSGKLIVIVEDDTHLAVRIGHWLQSEYECTVSYAANGEAGFALVKKHNPEVVLTDHSMPIKNGLSMAHELRASGFTGRIVMMSTNFPVVFEMYMGGKPLDAFMQKSSNFPEKNHDTYNIITGT